MQHGYEVYMVTDLGSQHRERCVSLPDARQAVRNLRMVWASERPTFEIVDLRTGEVVA